MQDKDTIDLKALALILWHGKSIIIRVTLLASIISVIAALSIKNIYKSEVILAPATESNELSKMASQFSGIASIAGISLPGGSDSQTKVINGIEVLRSFDFFQRLAAKHNLIYLLMAPSGWDKESNILEINQKVYDVNNNKWISKIQYSVDGKPTVQTTYRYFHRKKFSVTRDIKTGIVTASFEHYSPYIAQEVLNLLITEINDISRNNAIKRASKSIEYLEEEIVKTKLVELKSGLNGLIQSQIELIMIAQATPEHLFKILSPPIAPELKTKPKRSLICIIGFFLGAIIGSIIAISKHYIIQSKAS